MAKYVLFGGPFMNVDGPHKGERFGEVLEFTDDEAAALIAGGAAILPQDRFDALFSSKDVAAYPNALMQASAPETFKANLQAAACQWNTLRTAKENANAPIQ